MLALTARGVLCLCLNPPPITPLPMCWPRRLWAHPRGAGAACFGWAESFWALAPALPLHVASLVAKLYFKSATGYMVLHGAWHVVGAASVYRYIIAARLVAGSAGELPPASAPS